MRECAIPSSCSRPFAEFCFVISMRFDDTQGSNQTKNFSLIPVLCGSSLKNKGVIQLLDAVVSYLPSPCEVRFPNLYLHLHNQFVSIPFATCLKGDPSVPSSLTSYLKRSPTLLYVFKIQWTTQGILGYARVYQGAIQTKSALLNTRTMKQEKILRYSIADRSNLESSKFPLITQTR